MRSGAMSRAVVRVAAHFRQMVGDLGPFGRLVVDEGDGAGGEVQPLGDPAYRVRLAPPADLRQDEVVGDAERLQPCPGEAVVVGR
ncbi:hypothetical protein SMF913_11916 [Streptomyces malaysiensis]|uniref:Uncharacterized protein n=1 Tax=Streptomyces malaysiensis TaxID=92644 RepID=A0A2J7Z6J2_STRMQ|nr:hypothetical protein SMF913_11916 [Streptomyces malaysiensis]